MKIYIVEDSSIIRGHLIDMLSEIKGIEIAGMSSEPSEAILTIREKRPDLIVLDLMLYGGNGIDVLNVVKNEHPNIIIMVLTNYPYPQYKKRCLELGADYFFDKSTEFIDAIDIIMNLNNSRYEMDESFDIRKKASKWIEKINM